VFTVLLVFCEKISKLWTKDYLNFSGSHCFSSSTYSYSAAIGDAFLDCLIFTLPIPYVWSLSKLRARQRFGLIVIFALGFIVCVVALLQIPFIKRRSRHSTYFGGAINLLIAIQIALAIIAASLPDIRALIARSFPKFSPLHHRSLNNATRNAPVHRDVERQQGLDESDEPAQPRRALERFRKPDWLRSTLPASLFSTHHSQTDITRIESLGAMVQVPSTPEQIFILDGGTQRKC
jgi:hypothetical protein